MSADRPSLDQRLAARAAAALVRRELRSTFRQVLWIGPEPGSMLPPGRPVVLYANHHYHQDGYLLLQLVRNRLGRPPMLWMRHWDRIPLFAPLGVHPFPEDDPRQRLATMRTTARRLREHPETVFLYYPEGAIGPPDAGIAPFERERFTRLERLFPDETVWWPVAMHVTWWDDERPTALLTGDPPHEHPDGTEADRLTALLARLRAARPTDPTITLFDGGRSAGARWNLSALAPLCRRWLT